MSDQHDAAASQPHGDDPYFLAPIRRRWIDLLVLLPLMSGLLTALQVWQFAEGDSTTVRFLVKTLNIQTALFIHLTPVVLAIIFYFCLVYQINYAIVVAKSLFPNRLTLLGSISQPQYARSTLLLLPTVALLLTTAITLPIFIVLTCFGYAAIQYGGRILLSRRGIKPGASDFALMALQLGMVLFFAHYMEAQPWLPAETALVGVPAKGSVIYVLESTDGHTTFLDAHNGKVSTLPNLLVQNRAACDDNPSSSWWEKRSISFLPRGSTGVGHQPACPGL
ncbi:hypothetical protein [Catenuloplanes indicus]|uniref:Uncharacterized protein n=1 Tax=Catenuloplanes indicus TaxID=137267 RepID=A0AAE4AXC5_9ACTN|nr:hypothetical protein [Catenuloplanes indicus]MDQ0366034.1 hypothetical protein [Catenuloplanes indicus]